MNCEDLSDLIEPWAADELAPSAEAMAHVRSCAKCSARLALARQLEQLLASQEIPHAPPQFAQVVMRRIRRDWWQAEEYFDRWFNAALGVALLLIAAGIWLLFDRSGLSALTGEAGSFIGARLSTLVRQIAPSLPLYANTAALLIAALLIWRWTEGEDLGGFGL
jgi:hypothetical protein